MNDKLRSMRFAHCCSNIRDNTRELVGGVVAVVLAILAGSVASSCSGVVCNAAAVHYHRGAAGGAVAPVSGVALVLVVVGVG